MSTSPIAPASGSSTPSLDRTTRILMGRRRNLEAVAAGIVVAAGTGYVVYKAIESQPGQHIIGGLAHGDMHSVRQGVDEIRNGAHALGAGVSGWASHLADNVKH